jgi:hypothetical protein
LPFGDAEVGLGRLSDKRFLELEAGVYVPRTWQVTFSMRDQEP